MAGHIFQSVIHFPDVDKIDWISNNFINSRGGSFVAPITDAVTELMPVHIKNSIFGTCPENAPAILVCRKIFIDNGVRYGVIDCTIRTAKCTAVPASIDVNKTYTITYTGGGPNPGVTVTQSDAGKLFRIIDADSTAETVTYIDA